MATVPRALQEPPDFSLMLGGPVYQIFQRAHLAGPALELLKRRVLFITALAWLPLLLLSLLGGQLLDGMGLPFLRSVPFGFNDVKVIVAATVAPVLPLLLTIMPLEELLHRLVKIVF